MSLGDGAGCEFRGERRLRVDGDVDGIEKEERRGKRQERQRKKGLWFWVK